MIIYLDSSAIVKRYIEENGSEVIEEIYNKTLIGDATIAFSLWNIGEVLGALDRYHRRKWISKEEHTSARTQFIAETLKLIKLGRIKLVPVKTRILLESYRLIEEHHIYQADALQIATAKYINTNKFLTADKKLHKIARKEKLNSILLD
ncbi:MAG: PIN domain nuclease [Candidatus Hydrothermarchaeota archaeon]|nr:MAG: PIN domain nuclease [Candidatus Hydrothermarchaeota archaeon]